VRNALISGMLLTAVAGCASDVGSSPAPARVPGPTERNMTEGIAISKPLPDPSHDEVPTPPFNDPALVSQEEPELPAFVNAYNKVGRPRIVVWVTSASGMSYDEAAARGIDYAALQNILTDWLSAKGQVAMISPEAARQALSPQQAQNLSDGQLTSNKEVAERIHADILVMLRAEPTRQSGNGPAVRLVADVSNLAGGESIGRAVVDVPPPLDKPQLNTYTRFLARKLMADMTNAWSSFGAPDTQPGSR
jgi:hypothetical protein